MDLLLISGEFHGFDRNSTLPRESNSKREKHMGWVQMEWYSIKVVPEYISDWFNWAE